MTLETNIQIYEPRWKNRLRPYGRTIRAICETTLKAIGKASKNTECCVVLADDKFIRDLNSQYRGSNKPTNVLSFEGEEQYLGDVVISFETIEREAKGQGKSFNNHATHMLVHGLLHLGCYDHESDKTAEAMEKMEIKILKKLNVSNPYL